ncbi:sensor histidine kinase [Scatolibacter rhodanostii]|uniref:sensor histidine kinase n=1 Tax=Scatolibacter rhodanostii TaxID=2014781 RepID=UPI000C08915F|nr:histidine kinase [Scatolibacter rhodanostii]
MKKFAFLQKFKINTLRKRFFLIVTVGTMLSLTLVIAVSYVSLKAIEKTKIETSMVADLKEMSDNMDSVYYALLQISQQMISTGSIGHKYDQYLTAEIQYDRIDLYKQFSESVNIAVFGSKNITLVTYLSFDSVSEIPPNLLFSNFMVSENFDPRTIPSLLNTDQIYFQALHTSHNSVMERDVLSVMRPTVFENGTQASIYIEAYSDILSSIEHRSQLQETQYVLLQLDPQNTVCFSNSEDYRLGETIELASNEVIQIENYIGVTQKSGFGYTNILLMPATDYKREMNNWFFSMAVVVLIALGILVSTATLLIWLIYHPLRTLQNEMQNFSEGDFVIEKYNFDIEEFDSLFHTFNVMKRQIKSLVDETQEQEKVKAKLELEKLYYQINPHFLMNTLNSVHWLAVTNHQPEIDAFINRLNYILGYSLGKADRRATLRTELKALKMYLDLQKMRYDFDYILDIEEGPYLDKESARFILQPIAENAVCHNMDEFGHLWVTVRETPEYISIKIKDDGKGFQITDGADLGTRESRKNKGIGLQYVKMSLEAFYQGKAEIKIQSQDGAGTEVELILPQGRE